MLDNWRYLQRRRRINKDTSNLDTSISKSNIENSFVDCNDFKIKEIYLGKETITIYYMEGIVDQLIIDDDILKPIVLEKFKKEGNIKDDTTTYDIFSKIEDGLIPHLCTNIRENLDDAISDILDGCICLIDDKSESKAFTIKVKKVPQRSITEPNNENIIKGSKEAFIESLKVNVAIIRNRLHTNDLKSKSFEIGTLSKTEVVIMYIDKKVDPKVLEAIVNKIKNIQTDKITAPADFEEQMADNKYSIFPQMIYTEKTDKIVANLMDGKVCAIIDGFPTVYILPAVFNMFFQAVEDYATNYAVSTILRILRYICFLITLLTPALYIAITTFHQEMLPTDLAISIIRSKQGSPFPVILEVIFMLLSFEILIEASTRLPKTIGQTISIVGGLIIGEAAVSANFVSPAVVVIIAITGIAGFLMPNQDFSNALRLSRFALVILSGIAGLYGTTIGLILLFYYLSTLEPLGIPYFTPFASNEGKNLSIDTVARYPMKDMRDIEKEQEIEYEKEKR